ncbi:MAG: bifunctional diaminohydroxyphosphoribosylaminopyrimidine deaminase/5-amino-6-(5-phosphoribosylamino)uracil reductase RibD [Pseudomonadota bacterium]
MTDNDYLRQAVALATRAWGQTAPNPLVGCVLVRKGEVVAEGWHRGPGTPHAEADALQKAGAHAQDATAYVTLEPCNHHGQTPPCSEALIKAGVAEVVYAVADPNPVAAGGAERLAAAGVKVRKVIYPQAEELVRPWIHSLTSSRPYVYAKLAMSLDGYTATRTGQSKWITGPEARAKGHNLRQQTDAILVGVGTVLADDPRLDPRPEGRESAPSLKVVLDTHLRTPLDAKLLSSPGPVLMAVGPNTDADKRAAFEERGATVLPLPLVGGRPSLPILLRHLKTIPCQSVMVEGGGSLLGSAFDEKLVDEVWAFMAPLIMGGGQPAINGIGPAHVQEALRLENISTESLGQDLFLRGTIAQGVTACSQVS